MAAVPDAIVCLGATFSQLPYTRAQEAHVKQDVAIVTPLTSLCVFCRS